MMRLSDTIFLLGSVLNEANEGKKHTGVAEYKLFILWHTPLGQPLVLGHRFRCWSLIRKKS
jgi:hypothetical protein